MSRQGWNTLKTEPEGRNGEVITTGRRRLSISTNARQLAMGAVLAGLTVLPVRSESLQERLPICFDCHGQNGQSERPDVPSLGAQQAMYTLIELVMFRDKLRITEPMNEMVKGLSDDELRTASEVIAKSRAPEPTSDSPDPSRIQKGRTLAEQNRCNVCHQPNFQALGNVPRLASQREDYLLKALRGYKSNSRRGYDAQMSEVVYPMKDDDFIDLAYFLARTK
jgi:cytochrome c553